MVSAYHLIWTAYGWWLPNDPRGSMSREIRAASLQDLGELHYGRRRVLPAWGKTQQFYAAAADVLKHSLLTFTDEEIATIANQFEEVIRKRPYTCYACAIMPDHVHLVIRKHRDEAEEMIARLQEATRIAILAKPQAGRELDHPVWGGPGWKVYLDTRDAIRRTIEYVRLNPIKAKHPEQNWPFVKSYDGWLAGIGNK